MRKNNPVPSGCCPESRDAVLQALLRAILGSNAGVIYSWISS